MNPTIKNILLVVLAFFVGSIVNMSIINLSGSIIPAPEGADTSSIEGMKKTIHLFEAKHYIFPFLAHALGTFSGALFVGLFLKKNQLIFGLLIGLFFLVGGAMMVFMLPSPLWFNTLDLTMAYIPMGIGGAWIGKKIRKRS